MLKLSMPTFKEAHSPVDCSTVDKWILKNNDEAENVTWILVHSKPCPQCKRPIEKSVGCNHMKCSICGFRFCWICLVSLKNHSCNKYKDGGADDSTERKTARKHLGKYTHYYQRWAANHKSMDHAVKYVKNMQTCARVEELCFILAWLMRKSSSSLKMPGKRSLNADACLSGAMHLDITCLNMNMQRYTSLNMCKVWLNLD